MFSDLATLCLKPMEDFQAVVTNRVQAHQAQEAARVQAETARIAEQERVKAEAAVATKVSTEVARPTAETTIVRLPGGVPISATSIVKMASEIVNDNADIERLRLDTLLNSLTANEISKVLSFVQELCRQAA